MSVASLVFHLTILTGKNWWTTEFNAPFCCWVQIVNTYSRGCQETATWPQIKTNECCWCLSDKGTCMLPHLAFPVFFPPPSVSTSRYRHNNRFFAGDSIIGIFFFNCEASNHSNVSLSNDLGLKVNSEIEIGPSEIETRSTLTYSFFYEKWKVEVIKPKICFYCCGHPTWFMNARKTASQRVEEVNQSN